ncbi:MAG: complex I subunit 1 family protein [Myxococcota bacterium]
MNWLWLLLKIGVVLGIIFTLGPLLIHAERRVSAFIQGRLGPNRLGPLGLFQPVADILKLIMKEVILPERVDRVLFALGPLLMFIPVAFGWAVIPFGNQIGDEKLQIANLDIGVLFLMSVLSVGVYGITLGGWASNNKYGLLGSLRASAQLISYELSMGLTILMVVMMAESVDPQVIVMKQAEHGWNVFGGGSLWLLPSGLLGFTMLFITALAENNRLPFDMAECEAELVGGYHTEYTSMGFGMFMFGEYVAMTLSAAMLTTLFLGGWHFPFLTNPASHTVLAGIISVLVFTTKVAIIDFTYIWIRWTLPRFRYDQIMSLGWKRMLPLALVNVGIVAVVGVLVQGNGG